MQENIKDIKQESYHADGKKKDTEDAYNIYFQIKKVKLVISINIMGVACCILKIYAEY